MHRFSGKREVQRQCLKLNAHYGVLELAVELLMYVVFQKRTPVAEIMIQRCSKFGNPISAHY